MNVVVNMQQTLVEPSVYNDSRIALSRMYEYHSSVGLSLKSGANNEKEYY